MTVPSARVVAGCAAALALAALAELHALPGDGLSADVGIQFHLAQLTLEGAMPVRDFEHSWNVLSWWSQAGLVVLSAERASLWWFLWSVVAGQLLAGLLGLLVGWWHGLDASWLLALTAVTVLVDGVPNGKYALPVLWLVLLRPGARSDSPVASVVVRFVAAALLLLAHIELAVMLCAGTALHDALGTRRLEPHVRAARVLAMLAGVTAAAAAQVVVYARAGVAPQELFRFLVLERAQISDAATAYGWSLLDPPGMAGALYPATLLLPFVPALWRRLSDTTRLTAALHLSMGIVALQTVDPDHVRAASGLLVVLAVLGAWDVLRAPRSAPSVRELARLEVVVLGAAWSVGTLLAAVRLGSVLVLPLLLAAAGAALLVARSRWSPAFSAGAVAGCIALVAAGTVGATVAALDRLHVDLRDSTVAPAEAVQR